MPKVKVGDINMYYEIHGEGESFVMILGLGVSTEVLSPVIPEYSREYRLILFDNRGAGLSDAPDIPYTFEMMADDLAGLLDAISIESAHIWGSSMGGVIAQQFVLRHPEKVRSLILACTACRGVGPDSDIMTHPDIKRLNESMSELSAEEIEIETLRTLLSHRFIENNPDKAKQYSELLMKRPATPQGVNRQGQAMINVNFCDCLTEIKVPTLVISGDDDKYVPVNNSRLLASRIPDAELVVLEGMGHSFWFEGFDETTRIVLDFLRKHSDTK